MVVYIMSRMAERALQTTCSVTGVLAAYWAANRFIAGRKLPDWMAGASDYCMGVYLFQQFVLTGLYYHSPLPSLCGTYALPWAGLAVTVPASFAAAFLMRKTRVGRFLIG